MQSDRLKELDESIKLIRQNIYLMIEKERERQNKKWGFPQYNSLAQWGNILTEEHGEAIKELTELDFRREKYDTKLIRELVEEIAVAVSIIEHLSMGIIPEAGDAK